jgi:hypothetical protein
VVNRRPLTAETRVRARIIPCGICDELTGSRIGFSLSSSGFSCQITPLELHTRISETKAVPQHTYGGARGENKYASYSSTISALDGGEWSASRPGRAFPRGKDPRYPLYRRLRGPQSRYGHRGLRKISFPCRGSNLDLPVVQFVVRHYTDCGTPALILIYHLGDEQ